MKECFVPKEFNAVDTALIKACNQVLNIFVQQGYTMSLRQLFYQLVSRNIIPNRPEIYERLSKVITDARMAGLVDWDHIVDRGRITQYATMWSGPDKLLKNAAKSFKLNRWKRQPVYIEVMVEKQALEGVLCPVCLNLGIRFTANKGYSSSSAVYAASRRIFAAKKRGKTPVVLYLGDHDASGIDMTRDVRDRLKLMCGGEVDVKRLALNKSQVDEHKLPPNPAKMSDSRARDYTEKYGHSSWELDALSPNVLAKIIKDAVYRRIDRVVWDQDAEYERRCQAELLAVANVFEKRARNRMPIDAALLPSVPSSPSSSDSDDSQDDDVVEDSIPPEPKDLTDTTKPEESNE